MSARRPIGWAVAGLAGVVLATAGVLAQGGAVPRAIYITATARDAFVTDLTTADLEVKESGKTAVIASVAPAIEPLRVVVLIQDNGTGHLQQAASDLIQQLLTRGTFSIWLADGQATTTLVRFTNDAAALSAALETLRQRPASPDTQILDGIVAAARDLKTTDSARRALVVMTMGGRSLPGVNANYVLDEIAASGASVHLLAIRGMGGPGSGMGGGRGGGMAVNQVFGDAPRQSGGREIQISLDAGARDAARAIAATLANQYRVVYTLPAGTRPNGRVDVSSKRRGVEILAPRRVPS